MQPSSIWSRDCLSPSLCASALAAGAGLSVLGAAPCVPSAGSDSLDGKRSGGSWLIDLMEMTLSPGEVKSALSVEGWVLDR